MPQTVLITGASSGIGLELTKLFAKDGYSLLLVAHDEDRLQATAAQMTADFKVEAQTLALDLSAPTAPQQVFDWTQKLAKQVDILVNNAGFATYGFFAEIEREKDMNMLRVNVLTLTELTKLFLPGMLERKQGKILNLASTAAFLPGPLMAVYYASKAYVLSFSEALSNEVAGTGVTVTALCPGPTNTGFVKRAALENSKLFKKDVMGPQFVAKVGYDGLMAGKSVVVAGLRNYLGTLGSRLVPRALAAKIARMAQERQNAR